MVLILAASARKRSGSGWATKALRTLLRVNVAVPFPQVRRPPPQVPRERGRGRHVAVTDGHDPAGAGSPAVQQQDRALGALPAASL